MSKRKFCISDESNVSSDESSEDCTTKGMGFRADHDTDHDNDARELLERINGIEATPEIKKHAMDLLKSYRNDNENGANFRSAIEKICQIPWNKFHNISVDKPAEFLENSFNTMNRSIYGQEPAKLELIEFMATYLETGGKCTRVIGLQGEAGVGKTSLAFALKEALGDRPFRYFTLGGANDLSMLIGSRPVWKGSSCGQLTNAVIEAKCMNPILYFDEVDKISNTEEGCDVSNFLLHLTDPAQNTQINDRFTGINIDLSQALIVFSYNDRTRINKILLDRIKEIPMNGFNDQEKIFIAKDYIIPKLCAYFGCTDRITFAQETISYINSLTVEKDAGVRPLIKLYEGLISKIITSSIVHSTKRATSLKTKYNPIKLPTVVTREMVGKLLH